MTVAISVAIAALAILLLILFAFLRMGWRFFKGDTEMESGGSFGKQFFDRDDKHDNTL